MTDFLACTISSFAIVNVNDRCEEKKEGRWKVGRKRRRGKLEEIKRCVRWAIGGGWMGPARFRR